MEDRGLASPLLARFILPHKSSSSMTFSLLSSKSTSRSGSVGAHVLPSVHTAKWVVDKCFAGDLVEGRTVLLVVCPCIFYVFMLLSLPQTHNVAMTQSLAGFVVSVGTGGRIVAQGTVLEVLGADKAIFDELKQDKEAIEKSGEEVDKPATPSSDGKLVVAEEVEVGHLGWQPRTLSSSWKALGVLNFSQ